MWPFFHKIYFCKKAVLLQIYISVKKQFSYGTVFLHNIYIYIYRIFFFLLYPPRIAFATCGHKLCKLYLIWNKLVVVVYNCPCVYLFLLDQCVINVVYVCLSCLKVIGQYATWCWAHSWMIFFFTASKSCLIILFFNFFKEML